LREVLALEPRNFDALLFLGVIAYQHGRHAQAVELMSKAVAVDPSHAPAFSNLGIALEALGDAERAAAAYRRAIVLQPAYADAHVNLGGLLAARGDLEGAAACFRRALELAPEQPVILANLGNVLRELGRLDEAEARLRRSLAAAARRAPSHAFLGQVLQAQGRTRDAIASYRQSLALDPRAAETFCDLGNALSEENELDDAVAAYRSAIELKPDYARAHAHLATTLLQRADLEAATASSDEAMRLRPDLPYVRLSRAHLKLMQGDYATGLPLYEARFHEKALSRVYSMLQQRTAQVAGTPRWQGEDAKGASLLVWADHGLGDSLMMLRYLPLLKARGVGRLAVYCEAPLVRLVRTMGAVDEVIPASEPLPVRRFSLQCPLMSLPLAFGTRLETIPREVPYLRIPPAAEKLAGVARPRVGLLWAGNPANPNDRLRSVRLERLAPLVAIPGPSFVSLQKEDAARELPASGWPIVDRMAECGDLLDTAALIGELDLVIGVDSAVVHLAGALGKPVWLLNRFESEWRWMRERETSPWYPTLRLLRQPRAGDWDSVIALAARELSAWLAGVRR
jgi:tetratricopeptide (TPR) repeat protein